MSFTKYIVALAFVTNGVAGSVLNSIRSQKSIQWSADPKDTTPVQSVIRLLGKLQEELQSEQQVEKESYNEYSCWCRSQTETFTTDIESQADKIDEESSNADTAHTELEKAKRLLKEEKAKKAANQDERIESIKSCTKAQDDYNVKKADLDEAIDALKNALDAVENGIPPGSFIQTAIEAHRRVDPSDPEFQHSSGGVLDLLNDLDKKFREDESTLTAEHEKAKGVCEKTQANLNDKLNDNVKEIETQETRKADETKNLGVATINVAEAQKKLTELQSFLKETTGNCELRAGDFDQRDKARGEELEAVETAIKILSDGNVATNEGKMRSGRNAGPTGETGPMFVQVGSSSERRSNEIVEEQNEVSLSSQERLSSALELLSRSGNHLNSQGLLAIGSMNHEPLDRVMKLIQSLIERLLNEQQEESKNHGFCQSQIQTIKEDRKNSARTLQRLMGKHSQLEVKHDKVLDAGRTASQNWKDADYQLKGAQEMREREHEENMEALEAAQEGHTALKQAHEVLRKFYHENSYNNEKVEETPLQNPDAKKTPFEGEYKGAQTRANGVLGMLEVCITDFETSIADTKRAEKESSDAFAKERQIQEGRMSGEKTAATNAVRDFVDTKQALANTMEELQATMDEIDALNERYEALKPQCIDSGMTAEERVQKREAEIAALKNAKELLTPQGK